MKPSLSKEWVLSIPKTINSNGCWIPVKKPDSNGYVRYIVGGEQLLLHRVAMCLWYDIDYNNRDTETRHSGGCSRACFLYSHLTPGTTSENVIDSIRHGTQYNARKLACPKCNTAYSYTTYRVGDYKGKTKRYCPICQQKAKERWKLKARKDG